MRGVLRVLPYDGSPTSHRVLLLHRVPAESFLEDLVGGDLSLVTGFDSILYDGSLMPCLALKARHSLVRLPNSFANLLWLQAMIRKTGFSSGLTPSDLVFGTVALLFGDPPFMQELLTNLLDLNFPLASEPKAS